VLFLTLLACAGPPEEAPTDLDALLHWFFVNRDTATEEELRAAADNLRPLITEPTRGTVSLLTTEEQGVVEMAVPADPANATGIYVAGPVDCSLEDMERVRYALDQEGLYESATGDEAYIDYSRVYLNSIEDYEARTSTSLEWETTYTVKPVLSEYTAVILGGLRGVPATEDATRVVVDRAHLPSPAVFVAEGGDYFDQDYQLDVMLADGDTSIHIYAVWRDLESATLPDESDGVQNLMMNGFEDFDRDTELVCAAQAF
jgi:hypothetical protein